MDIKTLLKKKKRKNITMEKIYDLRDMLEYIEKNVKPRPRLDVVKWMEKHGR